MTISLAELQSSTVSFWRRGSAVFDLPAKAKLNIRTKEQAGEWTDLLDAQVPNGKLWHLQITVYADEADEVPD